MTSPNDQITSITVAQKIILNGYAIVPIKRGSKAPTQRGWNDADYVADDVAEDGNIGIKLVDSLRAVDVDIYDADIAQRFEDKFKERFGEESVRLKRIGYPPKRMFLIRTDLERKHVQKLPGIPPVELPGIKGKKHSGIEVLADGQQFVAHGIHPDTRQPYEWTNEDVTNVKLADLIYVGSDDLLSFIDEFATEVNGTSSKKSSRKRKKPATTEVVDIGTIELNPLSVEDCTTLLKMYPAKELDYNEWLQVGMALHHNFDGGDEGLNLWGAWSKADGERFDGQEIPTKWDSFGQREFGAEEGSRPITIATLRAAVEERHGKVLARDHDIHHDTILVAKKIRGQIRQILDRYGSKFQGVIPIDMTRLNAIITTTFLSASKGKYFFLNNRGDLVQFTQREVWHGLMQTFGTPLAKEDISEMCASITDVETRMDAVELAGGVTFHETMEHITLYRQREEMAWAVDMFADKPRFEMAEDEVRIVLQHKPLKTGPYEQRFVDDYLQHFAELDELLNFIVASRFSGDRKRSYLWMHCASDFGKGFFLGAMTNLGILTGTSDDEIKKVMSGQPVGLTAGAFKRSMVLAIDEFKTVSGAIKQLQNEITISPKNQLRQRVQIYTKLFLSAEGVNSLVSGHGVESQFVNRMSYMDKLEKLTERELYLQHEMAYFRSVQNWIAAKLNKYIEHFREKGPEKAGQDGYEFIKGFHAKYGIGGRFGDLKDAVSSIASDFLAYLKEFKFESMNEHENHLVKLQNGRFGLMRSQKAFEEFVDDTFSYSERPTFKKKMSDVFRELDIHGEGVSQRKTENGRNARVLMVANDGDHLEARIKGNA